MFKDSPNEVSTCRSKGPKGELIERTYDYVIAGQNLSRKITKMEVVEDFESRPHKAVSFVVERETRRYRHGLSRGCLSCQEEVQRKREEEEEDEGSRKMQMKKEIAKEVNCEYGHQTNLTKYSRAESGAKLGLITN